jgi:Phosphoribosylformimino-5-aminoimidazole carboxamide ribonucleotide (ProFAR) isomerase
VLSGAVAIKGWTQTSNLSPKKFVEVFSSISIYAFIFTDIYKDGTLSGIEPKRVKDLLDGIDVPVIISGGVSSIEDLKKIRNLNNKYVKGVIIGRALYTGAIKLSEAIRNI